VPVGVHLSYPFQFHAVSLYSLSSLTHYRTADRNCLSVYSYLINFISRRQSLFSAQSNILPYSRPSVPVRVQLSYQFQFHAVSLYTQGNLTTYRTAVRNFLSVYSYLINYSFTPSVCILRPIYLLTLQLSVSTCWFTFILSI